MRRGAGAGRGMRARTSARRGAGPPANARREGANEARRWTRARAEPWPDAGAMLGTGAGETRGLSRARARCLGPGAGAPRGGANASGVPAPAWHGAARARARSVPRAGCGCETEGCCVNWALLAGCEGQLRSEAGSASAWTRSVTQDRFPTMRRHRRGQDAIARGAIGQVLQTRCDHMGLPTSAGQTRQTTTKRGGERERADAGRPSVSRETPDLLAHN